MQLTSYQSPRKKERLELLKFNQTTHLIVTDFIICETQRDQQ